MSHYTLLLVQPVPTAIPWFSWEAANRIADLAGIIGIPLTLIGLWISVREAHRSATAARAAQTAAQQAADAANNMRDELNRFDVVRSLSDTLIAFEEVKTLQRYSVWELLPRNYSAIKRELLAAKRMAPNLSAAHKKRLQTAIQTCASIEDEIETSLSQSPPSTMDVPRFNKALSGHMMEIQDVLLHIRSQIGDQ
jgi:ribosome-binding ATPase YchF (GTP1/OBG family)